jgi:hypothetical protein
VEGRVTTDLQDFDNGCAGGAVFAVDSKIAHYAAATYQDNTASELSGEMQPVDSRNK